MTVAPYFHVGVLVADLDKAIERFSSALGLTFSEPSRQATTVLDPEPHEESTAAVYSIDGPPYIELIEGHGDGVFSLERGEGVHHLGLWSPPFEDYPDSRTGRELPPSLRICLFPGAPTMWLTNPADLHGVRLELVDENLREGLEASLKSGRMSG